MLWTIITAIIGGLIIGALARLVMPGKQSIGIVMTILLGIVGSFLGSWICYNIFNYSNENGGWRVIPFIVGIVVAAILIGLYLVITGRAVGQRKIPRT
ncbi:MAG TPA: GlsB/YeaQ/YmgE family stress response membrane protein [Mycobacterium sp.]|jgi:uncharacterized membrane protein YeaQ/YmgE (transglycosylase-associated protein family)